MIGNLMQKGASRLPEIGSVAQPVASAFRRLRTHTDRKQVLLAGVAGVAIVAVGVTAVGYVRHARNLADEQRATSRIEAANIDLQDELAQLRDKVAASGRDLAAAQGRVAALTEEMRQHTQAPVAAPATEAAAPGAKGDKAGQLSQQLHMAEAERATLAARLSKAETDLAQQQAKQTELLNQIDQWQKKLEEISSDRDRLKARVGELEKQSALKHAQQVAAAAASAAPAAAPKAVAATTAMAAPVPGPQPQPAAEPQRVAGVLNAPQPTAAPQPTTAQAIVSAPAAVASAAGVVVTAPVVVAHGAIDQFARVLASAGVDVRHLFAEFGVNRDEGGPFIPAPAGATANTLSPEKLVALRAMVKTLPVSAPLGEYRVTSPFGVRADPENDRAGFHTGVDLAAPYDTPVYATAPGTVTFAGYRDDYGKIVEIDHGNGIATRYAHLHAFAVSVGQHVAAHQQIGYLGSSGRATGPHVHYEVVVNGEPQDPEKFMALNRYVQPMTTPVSMKN